MGQGSSRTITQHDLTDVTAESFLQISNTCKSDLEVVQGITITCQPSDELKRSWKYCKDYLRRNPGKTPEDCDTDTDPVIGGIPTQLDSFENQPPCEECYQRVLDAQKEKYQLYRTIYAREGGVTKFPSYDDEMRVHLDGIEKCVDACKMCVVTDNDQTAAFTFDENCSFSSTSVNTFKNALSENVGQALSNNQDVLSSLAGVFGAGDQQTVTANITNRIMSRVDVSVLNSLKDSMKVQQMMKYKNDGGQGIHQNTAVKVVAKELTNLNITNNLFSSAEIAAYQKLYNQENTIGELGGFVRKTLAGIGDASKTLLGQILIAVVSIIVFILVVLTSIAVYRYFKARKG